MTHLQNKSIKGYKFITSNMKSKEGDCLWKVGEWKHEDNIDLCKKGLHACRTALQSLKYIYGDKWFIVEAKGKILEAEGDKFVATDMKLIKEIPIDKVVKRFALFCAKDCLKNYEKEYPKDNRVSECIRITELYLDGKATLKELNAAWSAAWSAAELAAESAAELAAESAAWSARSAAWSAAESARSAAESARSARSARSAAWSAAIKRQEKELNRIIKEVLKNG